MGIAGQHLPDKVVAELKTWLATNKNKTYREFIAAKKNLKVSESSYYYHKAAINGEKRTYHRTNTQKTLYTICWKKNATGLSEEAKSLLGEFIESMQRFELVQTKALKEGKWIDYLEVREY